MRRRASLVLLAFAVFFTALSPLMRWYAFPRLAKIPPSQYQDMVLEAKNATLLDYATMKPKKVDKVSIVQTLKGNVKEAGKVKDSTGRDVVVWDTLSYVADPDGEMVSRIPERYIFDAHTQEPVHAKGEHVDGDPVRREGVEYKWPFLTEKRDYEYFDFQTRTSAPIHYKGTQNFRGLEVYYFEQTIPWTKVKVPKKLPMGATPEVVKQAGMERWYSTKRMFWVEPTTGAPVNGEEIHKEEMRWTGKPDKEPLTAFAGHVKIRPDYLDATYDLVSSQRQLVLLLTAYLPWGFLVLGGGLLTLSLLLEARSRRPSGPASDDDAAALDPDPDPQPAGV
ncbi:PorA family protein [Streptomyces daliensis]